MNDRIVRRLLWAGAVVVLVLGVVMTIQSMRWVDKTSLRFKRKLRNLNRLRLMEHEINHYIATQQALERLAEKRPASLADVLKDTFSGHTVDDIREFRHESVPGWIVRQKEFAFSQVPLGEVLEFVRKAESREGKQQQRPPWRLVKCDIRASSQAVGSGQVLLLLEAVEKEE